MYIQFDSVGISEIGNYILKKETKQKVEDWQNHSENTFFFLNAVKNFIISFFYKLYFWLKNSQSPCQLLTHISSL